VNPDRLFDLLPAVHREHDDARGHALRALLAIIGEQVDVVEDDIERLYANWFIETCDDWVVPYIGDLIGYRAVHDAGEPGDPHTARASARNRILIPRPIRPKREHLPIMTRLKPGQRHQPPRI